MRWVAKAKAELISSADTRADLDNILFRYTISDTLAALRQLRLEGTEAERAKWTDLENAIRSKTGLNNRDNQ